MQKVNKITVDGNGNIVLQDVSGQNIIINDTAQIKEIFKTAKSEYLENILEQIKTQFDALQKANKQMLEALTQTLTELLNKQNKSKTAKDDLLDLLGNNQIDQVIERLEKIDSNNPTLILVKSQWQDLRQQQIMGLLSLSEETTIKNKIRLSLLQLINQLADK